MLAWIVGAVMSIVFLSGIAGMTTQPAPVVHHTTDNVTQEDVWQEYHSVVYSEASDDFTRIYNGYETRWAKNGRLMLREGNSGPYKFVKRTA